jgi:hypothetical protein
MGEGRTGNLQIVYNDPVDVQDARYINIRFKDDMGYTSIRDTGIITIKSEGKWGVDVPDSDLEIQENDPLVGKRFSRVIVGTTFLRIQKLNSIDHYSKPELIFEYFSPLSNIKDITVSNLL